jgi:hypothetical protein
MSVDIDVITVGEPIPRITRIRHAHDYIVSVTWADGLRKGIIEDVDLMPVIMRYRVFQPLRGNIELFASAQLGEDGGSLIWDKGHIDMAAITVEHLATKSMTNT